jgi:hypothetical protein
MNLLVSDEDLLTQLLKPVAEGFKHFFSSESYHSSNSGIDAIITSWIHAYYRHS